MRWRARRCGAAQCKNHVASIHVDLRSTCHRLPHRTGCSARRRARSARGEAVRPRSKKPAPHWCRLLAPCRAEPPAGPECRQSPASNGPSRSEVSSNDLHHQGRSAALIVGKSRMTHSELGAVCVWCVALRTYARRAWRCLHGRCCVGGRWQGRDLCGRSRGTWLARTIRSGEWLRASATPISTVCHRRGRNDRGAVTLPGFQTTRTDLRATATNLRHRTLDQLTAASPSAAAQTHGHPGRIAPGVGHTTHRRVRPWRGQFDPVHDPAA